MASSSKATKFTTNIPPTEEDKEKAVAAAATTKKFTQQRQQQTHTACPPPLLSVLISPENKQASSGNFDFTTPGTGVPLVPPGGDDGGNFREEMTNKFEDMTNKFEDIKNLFDIEDARRENEKKQLTGVVNNRDDEIEELNEVNVAKNKEIERKEQQIIQDRAQYEDTLKGREEECRDLERQLTAAKIETQKNIDDLKGAENKYNQFEEETQRYKETTTAQITTMQDDTEKLEGTIAVLEQESVIKETAYKSTIQGLAVRNETLEEEVVKEKDISKQNCVKHVEEVAKWSAKVKFAKEDLLVKETANQNLRTENENLQGQIAGVQRTVETLEHEIFTLGNTIKKVRGEKEKLTSENTQLQVEYNSKEESNNTALTSKDEKLASNDETIKNVCAEKEKLTSENAQLQDKLKAKEESHNTALAALALKDEKLESKDAELTTKDQELVQLHAKVEQLGLEKRELKEVKEEQIEQMNDHWKDRERDEHEGALELLQEERARKQEELVRQQQELVRQQQELARQQQELARTEEKIARTEETPTPPIILDGRTVVIMDPRIFPLAHNCVGCKSKWCKVDRNECGNKGLKYSYQCDACPSICSTEKSWKNHFMGNALRNGCLPNGVKYASCYELIINGEFFNFKLLDLGYEPSKTQLDTDAKARKTELLDEKDGVKSELNKNKLRSFEAGWV